MRKIVIAATGASGSLYFKILLDKLLQISDQWDELALVMSDNAKQVWHTELQHRDYEKYPFKIYDKNDFSAPFASGSGQFDTMIIIPCSIRTMSEIATGVTSSLVSRAADVVLKEQRRLVLAVRETPLHVGHLRTLTTLAEIGAVVAPIVPAFYNKPKTVDDIINHTVGRLLDLLGIETKLVKRWEGGPTED